MGADCKSVAKASKVRILHLPRNSMRGPASTAGPLAFLGVGRTGRSRGGAECEFTTGQRAAKCEFTTGQRAAKCEFTTRSEEHTSELQSIMRISYAVFCLKKKKHKRENQRYSTCIY